MKHLFGLSTLFLAGLTACQSNTSTSEQTKNKPAAVRLLTLDPGHFHAALVQKSMYPEVDSVVHVYAPEGPDVELHLQRVNGYNSRAEAPTHWKEEVYQGADFFQKMLSDKAGNVVVIAGNNEKKTEYIKQSLDAGFHVLADKPMAIDKANFELLKEAFASAASHKTLLYDIMTERHEITTVLQREFSMLPEVFGTLEKGTPDNPAVIKESVHHFYKFVSGSVLTRPAWFMDVTQEGEGIVDVTTHLVDLVQWAAFPEQIIDYEKDIQLTNARRWATDMGVSQFNAITKGNGFPEYLKRDVVHDTLLKVYANGEINYQIRGVHAKVAVTWVYKAPEGAGDTHYSIMRGTKANLVIRQGKEQQYKPTLYLEPIDAKDSQYESQLMSQLKTVEKKYPGISLQKVAKGWEVIIPDQYKEGHEAHFAKVTQQFLEYLQKGNMPAWEVPNMIAKYYITTKALDMARSRAH